MSRARSARRSSRRSASAACARSAARAAPRYLSARDEPWVRAAFDAFDAWVGRTVGERDAGLPPTIRAIARENGVCAAAADGIAHVLSRRFVARVDARIDPTTVRAV